MKSIYTCKCCCSFGTNSPAKNSAKIFCCCTVSSINLCVRLQISANSCIPSICMYLNFIKKKNQKIETKTQSNHKQKQKSNHFYRQKRNRFSSKLACKKSKTKQIKSKKHTHFAFFHKFLVILRHQPIDVY